MLDVSPGLLDWSGVANARFRTHLFVAAQQLGRVGEGSEGLDVSASGSCSGTLALWGAKALGGRPLSEPSPPPP